LLKDIKEAYKNLDTDMEEIDFENILEKKLERYEQE